MLDSLNQLKNSVLLALPFKVTKARWNYEFFLKCKSILYLAYENLCFMTLFSIDSKTVEGGSSDTELTPEDADLRYL